MINPQSSPIIFSMNPKERSSEQSEWRAHARQIQADLIADQIFGRLEAEGHIGIPVSEKTAHTMVRGFSGEAIDLEEILGNYGNESSEVLRLMGTISRRNALATHADQLKIFCKESVDGIREWNLKTSMDLFWESAFRMLGGHRNEPILEAVQNGWEAGTMDFLSEIGGSIPLIPYPAKLLDALPVQVEKTIVGEKMFFLDTKVPNVQVKYWYNEGYERPNMAVRVMPF